MVKLSCEISYIKLWLIEIIVPCVIGRTVFQHNCKNLYKQSALTTLRE